MKLEAPRGTWDSPTEDGHYEETHFLPDREISSGFSIGSPFSLDITLGRISLLELSPSNELRCEGHLFADGENRDYCSAMAKI